jgi:hypothetical protein
MPVSVKKVGKQFRVVESATGKIAKTLAGKARDGGGHASKTKAVRQARAMNTKK